MMFANSDNNYLGNWSKNRLQMMFVEGYSFFYSMVKSYAIIVLKKQPIEASGYAYCLCF